MEMANVKKDNTWQASTTQWTHSCKLKIMIINQSIKDWQSSKYAKGTCKDYI